MFPMIVTGSCSSCLSHFSLRCDENFHGHPGKFYFPSFSVCTEYTLGYSVYFRYSAYNNTKKVLHICVATSQLWRILQDSPSFLKLQVTEINKTWGNYEFSMFIHKIYVRKPLAVILGLILDEGWFFFPSEFLF